MIWLALAVIVAVVGLYVLDRIATPQIDVEIDQAHRIDSEEW